MSIEKINILLVDDRPENLLALEAIIENEEYNLIKAYSGEEALKYLLKTKFALILLDVQMPGMDGFSTAKMIKAREKTKSIPILFITANNMESEHIFMGYSVGGIDYILKPVDPLVLKAKVEGFVNLYKMKSQLFHQAEELESQKNELLKMNDELSATSIKLRLSEAMANVINETSLDSMLICDQDGIIIKINPTVQQMFDVKESDLIGANILNLFTNEEANTYLNSVLTQIQTAGNLGSLENKKEISVTKKDGTTLLGEVQIGIRRVQGIHMVACTIKDITKQKQNEALIKHMAYHDYLTSLPNRRALNEYLSAKIQEAKMKNESLSFLYIDMDRFKYINDSLGHAVGDQVLKEIADRLLQNVRKGDIVSRVSGDEFNIILPNTDRETSLELAEKIVEAFQKPFVIHNYELYITTSIGLSIFPYDAVDYAELIKNADIALYRAKELGKNKFNVFHTGMNIQSYRSLILQNDLRKAIHRKELEVFYQPRVDVESGRIIGAEALLRWHHPSWGMISPAEFIPLAEETGHIIEIGKWVIQSVCQQLKLWDQAGFEPIVISINFSPQQFLQQNFIATIQQLLQETGTNPKYLEIEITESILMNINTDTQNSLVQLRNMGFSVSIDDFGTGYSSLFYLSNLPINILKIDRSFITGIEDRHHKNRPIISTIISLAKELKLSVVAEGVETVGQLEFLSSQKCNEIQGFLYSPPLPVSKFEELLLKGNFKSFTDENLLQIPIDTSGLTQDRLQNKTLLAGALDHIKNQFAISTREIEVFELILDGLSNKEISGKLFISEHTVKNHITSIFQKLRVNDRSQAMSMVYMLCIDKSPIDL